MAKRERLLQDYSSLKNLLFIDPIPKVQVQSMLELFDICFIGLKKEELFKYGVSPNKLFDYMYSSKPILYAIESGKSNIVQTSNCGITVEAQNPQAIKDAVVKIYNMTKPQRERLGQNGKDYVLANFTYDKLAQKYDRIIKHNTDTKEQI